MQMPCIHPCPEPPLSFLSPPPLPQTSVSLVALRKPKAQFLAAWPRGARRVGPRAAPWEAGTTCRSVTGSHVTLTVYPVMPCSYLVMPFMGTDLGKLMKHERLSEDRVQFLVYQMLKGLKVGTRDGGGRPLGWEGPRAWPGRGFL